ncbi:peptide/nickel transport system substrate-binding protein [Mumia flava]|uniref:Peptide/nickel transport system substrate-binding protein n=1 Tax=Mumia flava TaxID=1348852 RepID=A0A0B2BPM2_9ACTN|nr:ABC transporter substrate-binding protein [Mumia flava]PJJ57095.1 peptide/nickel transport system substrate-binding protein [Mumia flava]
MRTRTRLVALGAIAALAATGCSGSDGGGGDSTASGDVTLVETTDAGTEPVDHVTWGLPNGEPTTLDPAKAGAESESSVVANLCEGLLQLQPDFSLAPGLATSADWTDDTTFVIDLDPDATFWNGNPVTPADVLYTFQRHLDPATQSVYGPAFMAMKDMKQTGPNQVTLTFETPDAQFRNTLAGGTGMIVEAAYAKKAGAAFGTPDGGLMCTGPFQLESWEAGESVTLRAYDGYRGGAPLVSELEFRFVADSSTLTSALMSGDIDGAYQPPVQSSQTLSDSGVGTLYVGPSTASASFGPASETGPAADPRVRQALDLAIDKNLYVKNVLRGLGEPLKTFTPPLVWEGDPAADTYRAGYDALPDNSEPDLDAAKKLIADAGADGASLVFAIAAGDQQSLQTVQFVQAAGEELGLDIAIEQLQPTEFSSFFYDPSKREGIDFVATTGYVEVPGALYYSPMFVLPGGLFNWSGYSDPQVSKLMGEASATTDPEVTAQKFVEAQAIFNEAKLQVSLGQSYSRLFLREGLTGAPASFAYISTPWAAQLGGTSS